MQIGPFTLMPSSLAMRSRPTLEEWEDLGRKLGYMQKNINWWIGDMIVFGEAQRGDDIYQAIAETVSYDYVDRCQFMSRSFPPGTRFPLSYSHHQAVANIPPKLRSVMLKMAITNRWTAQELRQKAAEL